MGDGVDTEGVVFTWWMTRFKLGRTFVVGYYLLGLFSGFSRLHGALICSGVLWVFGEVGVVEAWKFANDCLPLGQFWMVHLVCGVGANCIVHD